MLKCASHFLMSVSINVCYCSMERGAHLNIAPLKFAKAVLPTAAEVGLNAT